VKLKGRTQIVFENRVLRIFRPKREEVAGGWRTLHNEELHNLYASSNVIRVAQVKVVDKDRACSTHGRDEKCLQNFGRKT
jgi:hypothetical protein